MRRMLKPLVIGLTLPMLLLADFAPDSPLGLSVAREANAVIGRPLTPLSYAGVARRTTRRAVYATSAVAASSSAAAYQQQATAQQQAAVSQQQAATAQQQAAVAQQQAAVAQQQAGAPPIGSMVSTLPAGCVSSPQGGVQYFNCAGVYYRPAFQSNNLVYVVSQP